MTTQPFDEDEFDDLDHLPDPELVEEEEIAQALLETLLGKMGYEATITASYTDPDEDDALDRQIVAIEVTGADTQKLVGRNGEALAALQYVGRLLASQQLHRRVDFVVDVDGYRQKREEGILRLAMRMAEKVVAQKRPISLEPMPAFERRIIHMALRDHEQVYTKSVGLGDDRRVRLLLKGFTEQDERPYGMDRPRRDSGGGRPRGGRQTR
jgi:spoIIIJ-associated protein